jgi:hypothetical protein
MRLLRVLRLQDLLVMSVLPVWDQRLFVDIWDITLFMIRGYVSWQCHLSSPKDALFLWIISWTSFSPCLVIDF